MKKDRIVLKTHGINSSKEVGLIILPKEFYVKVEIEKVGDFCVEILDGNNVQLFSVCHHIKGTVKGVPAPETVADAEKKMAGYITDSLAEFLLYDVKPTFDTEESLEQWAGWASHAFRNCDIEWDNPILDNE